MFACEATQHRQQLTHRNLDGFGVFAVLAKKLICIYTYVCICIYTHVCICIYTYMYVFVFIHMYVFVFIHMYLFVFIHMYVFVFIHMYVFVFIHMYVFVFINMYVFLFCIFFRTQHQQQLTHRNLDVASLLHLQRTCLYLYLNL